MPPQGRAKSMAVGQASTKDKTATSAITGVVRAITQPGGKDIDWEKVRAAGAIIGGISVIVGLRRRRWRYIHTFGVVLAISAATAERLKNKYVGGAQATEKE
jgi:hypothetical protein